MEINDPGEDRPRKSARIPPGRESWVTDGPAERSGASQNQLAA